MAGERRGAPPTSGAWWQDEEGKCAASPPVAGERGGSAVHVANQFITLLGSAARAARATGMGRTVASVRDAADGFFARTQRPPLKVRSSDLDLVGFLRHRSFLANVARGSPGGYRRLFHSVLEPGGTVIDGGAHIGLYTIIAARAVAPDGRVIAVEPDPYNYAALKINVHRCGSSLVDLYPLALADHAGPSTFHRSAGTISGSLATRPGLAEDPMPVELATIDHLLADRALNALTIKLNIEGAERRALLGARTSIARANVTRLFVELHPAALAAAGETVSSLLDLLRELDFAISTINPRTQTIAPLTSAIPLTKGHLYCERIE